MKNICAIWWHGISTNSEDSYGHKKCSTYRRLFYVVMRGILYQTSRNPNGLTSLTSLKIPLDILTIYSPLIILNFLNMFLIYTQQNFSGINEILRKKKHLSWIFKFGSSIHTSVNGNPMTSIFLQLISPCWVVMFLYSHHVVFVLHS